MHIDEYCINGVAVMTRCILMNIFLRGGRHDKVHIDEYCINGVAVLTGWSS